MNPFKSLARVGGIIWDEDGMMVAAYTGNIAVDHPLAAEIHALLKDLVVCQNLGLKGSAGGRLFASGFLHSKVGKLIMGLHGYVEETNRHLDHFWKMGDPLLQKISKYWQIIFLNYLTRYFRSSPPIFHSTWKVFIFKRKKGKLEIKEPACTSIIHLQTPSRCLSTTAFHLTMQHLQRPVLNNDFSTSSFSLLGRPFCYFGCL